MENWNKYMNPNKNYMKYNEHILMEIVVKSKHFPLLELSLIFLDLGDKNTLYTYNYMYM